MRILLFVGTVDFVLSLIGYLYYRHTLPVGRTPAFGLLYLDNEVRLFGVDACCQTLCISMAEDAS